MSTCAATGDRPWIVGAALSFGLTACATAPPVTEAVARANAHEVFTDVVAKQRWDTTAFGAATALRTDVGWSISFPCREGRPGSLVIVVGFDGEADYSLAPPAACQRPPRIGA